MSTLLVFKTLFSLLFFIGGGPVIFESIESKTSKGGDVFNEVWLESERGVDTWNMKQSHHGLNSRTWDHIQIKVDTNKKTVQYFQLNKSGEEIEKKANCFRCHSSGPRLIRAKSLDLSDTLKVVKMNLLIKSYGDLEKPSEYKEMLLKDSHHKLKIKSCTECHRKGGIRSELTGLQKGTINHLVKEGQMPPWPHRISKKELRELNKFIYGF